ncbi:hypothetical protein AB0A05_35730 [Streptomyces sp. NPDC046374]|uniref:hypothetical protein n=1 Tax=Streptomyces sp. NPDC046374 TaxID=3154917 RepID=UPI0033D01F3F
MEAEIQRANMTPASPPPHGLVDATDEDGSWVRQELAHGNFEAWHFVRHDSVGAAPAYIVIRPAPGGDPAAIARGATTTVLRDVRPSDAVALVRDQDYKVQKYPRASQVDTLLAKGRRPGDAYLAALALRYERLADSGDRSPVRRLAEITGLPLGTVKSHLQLARRKGLLEAVSAKAGGRATDAAHRILADADAESDGSVAEACPSADGLPGGTE